MVKYIIFVGLMFLTSINIYAGGIGKIPMANTRLFYPYDYAKDCTTTFAKLKKEHPDLEIWKILGEDLTKNYITSFTSNQIIIDTSIYAQIIIDEDDTVTFKLQTFSSRIYTGIKNYFIKYEKTLNKTSITRINNYKSGIASINAPGIFNLVSKGYNREFIHIFFNDNKPYCNTYKYQKEIIY